MKTNLLKRVIDEPYRVFFPLGIIAGILGVSHWLFYALGWIPGYSMIQHSSIQIQVYMASFGVGFLLTAMPRFASAPAATAPEFFAFLGVTLFILVSYLGDRLQQGQLGFMVLLALLAVFALKRLVLKKKSGIKPPLEFIWLPIALLHGFAGTALYFTGMKGWLPSWAPAIGKPMMDQGFMLCLVLGVGSFLGPRLMGLFNPLVKIGSPGYEQELARKRSRAILFHACMALLLMLSFVLEGFRKNSAAFLIRAAVITLVFLKTRTLLPPKLKDQFVRFLSFSFWMVFLGHWAIFFAPGMRAALLHIVFIGGYSLMTFAVGTMVIFSHAGLAHVLRKSSWQLNFLAAVLAAALTLRVAALFYPEHFFRILGISAAFWLAGAICWLFYILAPAFRAVGAEEVERCHDEAKQRVQKLREE